MVKRMRHRHRGQAMVELAFGMFALALVASFLFSAIRYIVKSQRQQQAVRLEAGKSALNGETVGGYRSARASGSVEVEPLAADYIFGEKTVSVRETAAMPDMKGIEQP